jgi:hypothetical protein
MAAVPDRADFVVAVEGGKVCFTIDDADELEKIDRDVRRWSKAEVSNTIGMDIISLDVVRE